MSKYKIQSVERCFAIFDAIARLGGASRLGTIQVATSLPLPTVHRFLRVLCRSGYVHRTENGVFLLGYAFHRLADPSILIQLIRRLALRPLRQIAGHFDVATSLAVREGIQVVVVERISTPNAVKFPVEQAQRLDAHATALGKAMLGFLPERRLENLYAGFPLRSHTATTIGTLAMLQRRLVDVRKSGVATDEGETFSHIGCVAAPLIDRDGRVLGAISGSLPVWELTSSLGTSLANALRHAAHQISDELYVARTDTDSDLVEQGNDDDE